MNDTLTSALQDLIDRRARDALRNYGGPGTLSWDGARQHQTTLLIEALERIMDEPILQNTAPSP